MCTFVIISFKTIKTDIILYNTFSQKLEPFIPLKKSSVTLYVCGVTPYDTSHLGHAFVFVIFDTLVRFLQYKNYKVIYTQNVTDIDDPLIERANKLHTTWQLLADHWTGYLLNDFSFLNIEMPTHFVKATQELQTMIEIIQVLIDKKYAYIHDGTVYFAIDRFPRYGKLSKLDRPSMLTISAERGNDIKDPHKKNPLDFILWKKSAPGEPTWESPWSMGRPGWHIECTAMSTHYLGQQIDIHGGGEDLIFPHHESEIAQAEAFSGKVPFVKTWMHCAMVYDKGEKMSKSLGNLVYVQDLAKKFSANAIRYYLLSHHYRKEWEYNEKEMTQAAKNMQNIEIDLEKYSKKNNGKIDLGALENDLNTPLALKELLSTKDPHYKKQLFTVLGFC
jgi:L-cysteine:1D-myo-inositol 2-amino-2-deoxy-alpha-D-glucopyranoside ligase